MFFKNNKAFTLAEIMIVLSVIGVLTAVLLPVAMNATPDENVMKFKKAHSTLGKVITELVNSDKYYRNGDLGRNVHRSETNDADRITGVNTGDKTYFCQTFADMLSTKSVGCSEYGAEKSYVQSRKGNAAEDRAFTLSYIKGTNSASADGKCKTAQTNYPATNTQIVTSDGIVYFEESTNTPFGVNNSGTTRLFSDPYKPANFPDSTTFDAIYKVVCIDIDGIPSGGSGSCDDIKDVCPFGYGIRADGKIVTGKRADAWLEKSLQSKD